MAWSNVCAVILFSYFCQVAQGASILALFSSLSFTDHYVFRSYVTSLALRGHSLVVMTPYPGHFQFPEKERIIELDVSEPSAPFWDEYKNLVTNTEDYYPKMRAIHEFSVKLAIAQLRSKQMTALFINPNAKFDLVITEADVPLLYAVADKYMTPHIAITTSSGTIPMYEAKGSPTHPLVFPNEFTLNFGDLGIWQRFTEVNRYFHTKREYYNNHLPVCQVAAEKIVGLKKNLLDVEQDIDLLIVANNRALIGNRPSTPAIAYVDRLQIKTGVPLPQDLKAILDTAEKGVIFFSLGAIQESEQLSTTILQNLAAAFGQLPYTVLWKIGNTTMIEKPDNVIARGWFPQQEILAHPNVKAFLTHGGPRSLEEALFFEKPIIGLPLVKSRKVFITEITKHGVGEILDPYRMDSDAIRDVINLVASDDKYKQAVSNLKAKVQDPLISGPNAAVWWTEYVLRNQGARHIRSPSVGVNFYQYFMLDVTAIFLIFVASLVCLSCYVVFLVVKRVRVRLSRKPSLGGKFKSL